MNEDNGSFVLGGGYQKPELLLLAEKIYALKEEKRDLELKLEDEEFHLKYIPIRENRAIGQMIFNIPFLLPLVSGLATSIVVILICCIVMAKMRAMGVASDSYSGLVMGACGIVLLLTVLFLVFGGAFTVKFFLLPEIQNVKKLTGFQKEKEESESKVAYLKERINVVERELASLIEQQEAQLDQKLQLENRLREAGILFDEIPEEDNRKTSISLKESAKDENEIQELIDYYYREEKYEKEYLNSLKQELTVINREIYKINEDFENAKKFFMFLGIIFVIVIIVQQFFTDAMEQLTSILCLFVGFYVLLYADKKYTPIIFSYLVEEEHELAKEYAFKHNMFPKKYRRRDIMDRIQLCEKNIEELKLLRSKLENRE